MGFVRYTTIHVLIKLAFIRSFPIHDATNKIRISFLKPSRLPYVNLSYSHDFWLHNANYSIFVLTFSFRKHDWQLVAK